MEFALENGTPLPHETLEALPGVQHAVSADGKTALTVERVHQSVPALMRLLESHRATLSELVTHHATLEDVFLALTGRHLRDE